MSCALRCGGHCERNEAFGPFYLPETSDSLLERVSADEAVYDSQRNPDTDLLTEAKIAFDEVSKQDKFLGGNLNDSKKLFMTELLKRNPSLQEKDYVRYAGSFDFLMYQLMDGLLEKALEEDSECWKVVAKLKEAIEANTGHPVWRTRISKAQLRYVEKKCLPNFIEEYMARDKPPIGLCYPRILEEFCAENGFNVNQETKAKLELVVRKELLKRLAEVYPDEQKFPDLCEEPEFNPGLFKKEIVTSAYDQWERLCHMNKQFRFLTDPSPERLNWLRALPVQDDEWWGLELRCQGVRPDVITMIQAYFPVVHEHLRKTKDLKEATVPVLILRCPAQESIPGTPVIANSSDGKFCNFTAPTLKKVIKQFQEQKFGAAIILNYNMGLCSKEFTHKELPMVQKSRFGPWRGRQLLKWVKDYLKKKNAGRIQIFNGGGKDYEHTIEQVSVEFGFKPMHMFHLGHPAGYGAADGFPMRFPRYVKYLRESGLQFGGELERNLWDGFPPKPSEEDNNKRDRPEVSEADDKGRVIRRNTGPGFVYYY